MTPHQAALQAPRQRVLAQSPELCHSPHPAYLRQTPIVTTGADKNE